jgi:hypothetical protein
MTITTLLLVPAGWLRVVDTWQPLVPDDYGPPVAWLLTLRTPHLNGVMIWRSPDTKDLLDAAAEVIDGELRAGTVVYGEPPWRQATPLAREPR